MKAVSRYFGPADSVMFHTFPQLLQKLAQFKMEHLSNMKNNTNTCVVVCTSTCFMCIVYINLSKEE